jgi:hypothetical protein
VAYALRKRDFPKPLPGAEWQRALTFNAAEELMVNPALNEVFEAAIEKGVAVVHRTENAPSRRCTQNESEMGQV